MGQMRKDLEDMDENGKLGDWCFLNNNELIAIRYGEDAFIGLVILPISESQMPGKPHWQWNGDKAAPTLSPSILVHKVPDWNDGWHGWLRDGELITA